MITLSPTGLSSACTLLGVNPAELWAVLAVETNGFGFLAPSNAERVSASLLPSRHFSDGLAAPLPAIRFERHVFRRLTRRRWDASCPDLSNSGPGGYEPGAGEYTRLQRAMRLDPNAALQSSSWGIGQVMGFNFANAGYQSVEAMSGAMSDGEDAQLIAMANFTKSVGLDIPLRRLDWNQFALGYNGPDCARNQYAERLAAAHTKVSKCLPDLSYRAVQVELLFGGFSPGPIDGIPGPRTREAIRESELRRASPTTDEL